MTNPASELDTITGITPNTERYRPKLAVPGIGIPERA